MLDLDAQMVLLPETSEFAVTNNGIMFRLKTFMVGGKKRLTWVPMSVHVNPDGYLVAHVFWHGKLQKVSVHHIVLTCFKGDRPSGKIGLHGDDDQRNNNINNLRWGTCKDNALDMLKNGGVSVGQDNHFAKLNNEQVLMIKRLLMANVRMTTIIKLLGVTFNQLTPIQSGIGWKNSICNWPKISAADISDNFP
jgi:hypothetical protein